MHPSEPFPHFVDDYLAYLQEVPPSQASLDGVHLHDDLLEDLSRAGIDNHIRALAGFTRRLNQTEPSHLTPVERTEDAVIASNVEGAMYELEVVRTSDRSPQRYADTIGLGAGRQALSRYAPETGRARRVVSTLPRVPRPLQAARGNFK